MQEQEKRSPVISILYKLLNAKPIVWLGTKLFNSYGSVWDIMAITSKSAKDAICLGVKDEDTFDSLGQRDADMLREFISPHDIVLDIGCGIGRIEKYLARHCREIYGIDASSRMIGRARKRLNNVYNARFLKNNGRDLSIFHDNTFDFIFSTLVFQHMEREDVAFYLLEAFRVLKPNGSLYFDIPNILADENFATFINRYAKVPASRTAIRMRYYSPDETKKIVSSIGFKIKSIRIDTAIKVLAIKPQ